MELITTNKDIALSILGAVFKDDPDIDRSAAIAAIVRASLMNEEEADAAIGELAAEHELYFGPKDSIILL